MDDPQVYLEKLTAFSGILRMEGLTIGPKETADAAQVLSVLGFDDRNRVKTALLTVYAKSREEQSAFDRAFDGFFLSEEEIRKQAQEAAQHHQEQAQREQEARQELERFGDRMDLTQQQRQTYAEMPEEVRQKLRSFMDKYKGTAERNPKLYGDFIHSVFAKTLMEQQMLMEDAAVGCGEADPEIGLMYRDLSQFQDREIPKAIDMINTIARQLNGELNAKRKAGGTTGKLDFRRTIRKGLETGGSFYRLSYRKKRQRKKQLVVLCDVSGSMMQFSEFALRFIQSLNQVADSSRVFLFSEVLVEADPFQLQNMDLFRNYVKESGVYGRGTDLGTALEILCGRQPRILGPATTLLILSDTKTIDQPRAIAAMLEARRQAGRVLWLNPIPERKWQYLRSVQAMAALCSMVPCSTLRELADACRKLTNA